MEVTSEDSRMISGNDKMEDLRNDELEVISEVISGNVEMEDSRMISGNVEQLTH